MKHVFRARLRLILLLALSCAAIHNAAADSLAPNGGFEDTVTGWGIFVPDESKDKNCHFDVVSTDPHSGLNCARLQSDDFARFGIGCPFISVQPGEHYHVSVWIRADSAAQVRPKTPGFTIRLYLRQGNTDAAGGHLFIGSGNQVTRNTPVNLGPSNLPTTWTQIEAVIEIPPGVDSVGPGLFAWWNLGALYIDDFSFEKVDASTPVTPMWQDPASPPAAPTPK